jgi:hypothetical protein
MIRNTLIFLGRLHDEPLDALQWQASGKRAHSLPTFLHSLDPEQKQGNEFQGCERL